MSHRTSFQMPHRTSYRMRIKDRIIDLFYQFKQPEIEECPLPPPDTPPRRPDLERRGTLRKVGTCYQDPDDSPPTRQRSLHESPYRSNAYQIRGNGESYVCAAKPKSTASWAESQSSTYDGSSRSSRGDLHSSSAGVSGNLVNPFADPPSPVHATLDKCTTQPARARRSLYLENNWDAGDTSTLPGASIRNSPLPDLRHNGKSPLIHRAGSYRKPTRNNWGEGIRYLRRCSGFSFVGGDTPEGIPERSPSPEVELQALPRRHDQRKSLRNSGLSQWNGAVPPQHDPRDILKNSNMPTRDPSKRRKDPPAPVLELQHLQHVSTCGQERSNSLNKKTSTNWNRPLSQIVPPNHLLNWSSDGKHIELVRIDGVFETREVSDLRTKDKGSGAMETVNELGEGTYDSDSDEILEIQPIPKVRPTRKSVYTYEL